MKRLIPATPQSLPDLELDGPILPPWLRVNGVVVSQPKPWPPLRIGRAQKRGPKDLQDWRVASPRTLVAVSLQRMPGTYSAGSKNRGGRTLVAVDADIEVWCAYDLVITLFDKAIVLVAAKAKWAGGASGSLQTNPRPLTSKLFPSIAEYFETGSVQGIPSCRVVTITNVCVFCFFCANEDAQIYFREAEEQTVADPRDLSAPPFEELASPMRRVRGKAIPAPDKVRRCDSTLMAEDTVDAASTTESRSTLLSPPAAKPPAANVRRPKAIVQYNADVQTDPFGTPLVERLLVAFGALKDEVNRLAEGVVAAHNDLWVSALFRHSLADIAGFVMSTFELRQAGPHVAIQCDIYLEVESTCASGGVKWISSAPTSVQNEEDSARAHIVLFFQVINGPMLEAHKLRRRKLLEDELRALSA
jgi:hypothetical protein